MTKTRPRILIVDDSKLILRLGSRAMETAGFEVLTAMTPAEVQAACSEATPPDVLVVDVNMPEMNGDDLVLMLRDRLPTLPPIVMVSDMPENDLRRRARDIAATAYVSKQAGLDELVETVRRVQQDTAAQQESGTGQITPRAPKSPHTTDTDLVPPRSARRSTTSTRRTLEDVEQDQRASGRHDEVAIRAASSGAPTSRAPRAPEPEPPDGRQILLIDDSALIRNLVARALQKAGYRVGLCESAADVPKVLREIGTPDLVLVDLEMPEVLGDDLVVHLRATLQVPSPVVIFSNVAESELAFRAREAGADGFVSKRWGVPRMIEHVDQILGRESVE